MIHWQKAQELEADGCRIISIAQNEHGDCWIAFQGIGREEGQLNLTGSDVDWSVLNMSLGTLPVGWVLSGPETVWLAAAMTLVPRPRPS